MFRSIKKVWQTIIELWFYSSEGQFGALEIPEDEWKKYQESLKKKLDESSS